jgi:hypothetical protein
VSELDRRLDVWVAAGLISAEQASAIAAHEASHPGVEAAEATEGHPTEVGPAALVVPAAPAAPGTDAATSARAKPGSTTGPEAIGYVGAALALGAIVLLVENLWTQLVTGGRLTMLVLLTGLLFGAGLYARRSSSPAMQRLSSVLFTGTIAGVAWIAATVASDVAGLRGERVGVAVGAAATTVAIPLYVMRNRALIQLAVLASVLTLLVSILGVPALRPGALWHGLLVGTVGLAWIVLARGGWHHPRLLAEIVGAALVLIGAQIASFESDRLLALLVGALAAGLLVAVAVKLDELHLLVVGTLGLFVLVPQLVFEAFGDVIGAPATLLVVGLVLVLLAVGLGRARRGMRPTHESPPAGAGPLPTGAGRPPNASVTARSSGEGEPE